MKLKTVLLAAAISGAAISVQSAFAEGFYVGVDVGRSKTGTIFPGANMTKSTDTVGGVQLGYQFTQNWGAEIFYTGVGKFSATTAGGSGSGKGDSFGIEAVGTLPLADTFALFGRLGYASTKTSASSAPAQMSGATRSTATYGVGGQYNVNSNVGLRLAYDRYGAAVASGSAVGSKDNFNANVWSLGVVYSFR